MPHQAGRSDPSHRGIGVVDAPPAVKAECERQGLGNLIRRRRAEVGFVWHAGTVEGGCERIKNYRDDGNRWLFQNANSGWGLLPQAPYAPVLTGGPVVDAVWRRLLERAGLRSLPPLTDDPDLHLIVDGKRVDAMDRRGQVLVFHLFDQPQSVHVASREVVPSEFGIARDPRSLGVALRRIAVRQGTNFELIEADDSRMAGGFHDYEPTDDLRWTVGYAALPIEVFTRFKGSAEVVLHLAGVTRYPEDGAILARAAT